ncbi:C40 family peptidase [Providencia sp. PROV209]|uniref:C40 family peptidase n=1 Tax=Providencia sp. PROV209 TaxID=2949906 RepID=UPI00234B1AF2|nr:C40 family peptidase [Providencia sp. PROV209]
MIEHEILEHAKSMAPQESCGLIIRIDEMETYLPCVNQHADPENYFSISAEDYIQASQRGEVVAIVHSHPNGKPFLSASDRVHQLKTALSWWLVCDEKIIKFDAVPLLLGRDFKHGTTDCYGLFRDAYLLAGHLLPDFFREDNWWRQGKDLYLENLTNNGFKQVKRDIQPGDIILCCYASSRANHAAIYLGDQTILHHVPNQLSKREVYNERWQKMTHSIWRYRKWSPSDFTGISNDLDAASI